MPAIDKQPMHPSRITFSLLLAGSLILSGASRSAAQEATPAPSASPAAANPATNPVPKGERNGTNRFYTLHDEFLARGKSGPIGVLFMGDSITEGWRNHGKIWAEYFEKYQPANFGISGDRTQHVLWRIDNGELDGIAPKVVVLMIGTNNSGSDSAEQIAAGVRAIVQRIQTKLPQTKVLLLGIFPRGPRPAKEAAENTPEYVQKTTEQAEKQMAKIKLINEDLAKLDNGTTVRYLDIGSKFLGPDGKIPLSVMPDQLHLSKEGYQIWADAVSPLLSEMAGS